MATRRQNLKYLNQRRRRLESAGAKDSEIKSALGKRQFNTLTDKQLDALASKVKGYGTLKVQDNGNVVQQSYITKAKAYYGSSYEKDFQPSFRTANESNVMKYGNAQEASRARQERLAGAKMEYLQQLDELAKKAGVNPNVRANNKIRGMSESEFKALLQGSKGRIATFDGLYMFMTSDRWNQDAEQMSSDEIKAWYYKVCEAILS